MTVAKSRIVIETRREGPLFDGRAEEAVQDFLRSTVREVAEIGRDWVRIEALGMDRSGRGGTGKAAAGVELVHRDRVSVIRGGIREGEYAWPWLEGSSLRNQSSSFKGYHTFRRTRLRLRRKATPLAQARLEEFIGRMGGAP